MNSFQKCILLMCLAIVPALVAPKAMAGEWDKATKVTFNTPVEVPGAILQPGTYVFTVAPDSNGQVVQIWNEDRTKLYTTALAIPNYRLNVPDKPVVLFDEHPSASVPAVKAWFYPGDPIGREFVYPKAKATELASRTKQPVLAMRNEPTSNKPAALQTVVVIAIKPSGEEVDKEQALQSQPSR